jgi:nickel-dependent lactate racemase
VAALETIARHHSFPNRLYGPAMGMLRGNPFHELSVEAARRVGVDFIVNVVKNWRGEVVRAVAGDLEAAHQAGVAVCEDNWLLDLPHRYDVVVATPGGYPRDINLHQAQKAMSAAEQVVTPGGVIVLVAECRDGVGAFGGWLKGAESPRAVIDRFMREGFTAEHSSKAFLCARALAEHPVVAVCGGIPAPELSAMFFLPATSAQDAVDQALALAGPAPRVLALPYAVDCVPRVAGETVWPT